MKYTVTSPESGLPGSLHRSRLPQYLAAAAVSVGGFSMGTALGWSSPSLPNLEQSDFPLVKSDLPWIGSILTIGAALASLFCGIFIELFGRKWTMLGSSLFFLIGYSVISLADKVCLLLLGRFLTGIGVGSLSLTAPVFLAEISESEVRGKIGVLFQLMVVLGSLFSTVLGSFTNWRLLSASCCIVPLVFVTGIMFLPESPRFLARKGRILEAQGALKWLRMDKSIEIYSPNVPSKPKSLKGTLSSLKSLLFPSNPILKPVLITISLVLFNQICGISAVNFYTVDIFKSTQSNRNQNVTFDLSLTSNNSNLSAIIVQVVQVIAVLVSAVLVDKIGRRVLLLKSFGVMAISLFCLGLFFHQKKFRNQNFEEDFGNFEKNSGNLFWIPLVCVVVYNVGYSVGIGSLLWTVMGELLPSNVIGVVYALETSYNWALAFVITKYFQGLNDSLDMHNTFWLFAIACLVSGISVYFTVPETKGKSLEEIQEQFLCKNENKGEI